MSSVTSISSLLSQYLSNTSSSSSLSSSSCSELAELLSQTSDSDAVDTVSLSAGSQELLSSLLGSLGDSSTDDKSGSLYDVLISAANAKLIKSNPDLVNMILAVNEADSSEDTSSSTQDINLLTMSATDILSVIKQYSSLSSSTAASSPTIDETV